MHEHLELHVASRTPRLFPTDIDLGVAGDHVPHEKALSVSTIRNIKSNNKNTYSPGLGLALKLGSTSSEKPFPSAV